MPAVERLHELPPWTTILSSVRAFARPPDWLVGAVQAEHVRSVLIHGISEFASGALILQKCRAKHLLLSDAGTLWTGTYHLTTDTPELLADLDGYLRKTAAGLAALHSAGVDIGKVHCWEDELAGVRAFVQRLTVAVPGLAKAATPLFSCLEALSTMSPPDPPVPTHGTFRPSQVLLNQGQIGFIDFDSFCQAEPAMDLALFRAALIDRGMSAYLEQSIAGEPAMQGGHKDRLIQLEAIADHFLAQYAALRLWLNKEDSDGT